MFVLMPARHFGVFDLDVAGIDKLCQKLFEIIADLLVRPLSNLKTGLACYKNQQNMFAVVIGVDKGDRISVVLGFSDEVDVAASRSPEGFPEKYEKFVLVSVADALDGSLIRLRQLRHKLYLSGLKDAERQAGDHPLCRIHSVSGLEVDHLA